MTKSAEIYRDFAEICREKRKMFSMYSIARMENKSQIMKGTIDKQIFLIFIKKNLVKLSKPDNYVLNNTVYKRLVLFNELQPFLDNLKPHYYSSKQYYLDREMSYKRLVTVFRQLCKYFKIDLTSDIKYNKSQYMLEYTIKL